MASEEQIKILEDELQQTREELKQIMLDIRAVILEASSPLRWESSVNQNSSQNNSDKGLK